MPWRGRFVAPLLYMQRAAICKGGLHYAGQFAPIMYKVVHNEFFMHFWAGRLSIPFCGFLGIFQNFLFFQIVLNGSVAKFT